MATMYVYNIPTDETVNLRQTPGGTVLTRVPYGAAVQASSYNTTWHSVTYDNHVGYMMSEFLTTTNPNEGSSGNGDWSIQWTDTPGETVNVRSGPGTNHSVIRTLTHATKVEAESPFSSWSRIRLYGTTTILGYMMTSFLTDSNPNSGGANPPPTGTLTHGKINHPTWVNIRTTASSSGTIVGRLFDGDPLDYYANEIHTVSGIDWYRINFDGDAYIQAQYVISETYNRSISQSYSYNSNAAVTYASNHTQDGTCTNFNTSFGMSDDNDCANFVNQCICAGGLPMFDGWAKPVISSIPSSWNNSNNWIYTNRSRCALIAKGRIYRIDHTQVQKGDIIYTFNDSEPIHEQHTHVVIAATAYNSSTGKCKIHGHTSNQHYEDKTLSASASRCYRVAPLIKREEYEVRLSLPSIGNGASLF